MEPEEYKAVLERLERLERRDRRIRLERLFMLAAIVWLLATGPAARLLITAAPTLQAGERGVQSVAARSLAGLRHILRVQPVLDPATVAEDEREAFNEPVHAPNPEFRNPGPGGAKPLPASARASVAALASHRAPSAPESSTAAKPKSSTAATASKPEVSQVFKPAPSKSSGRARATTATTSKRALASRSTAASARSLAAAGLSIGRDVQKRLTSLPGDASSQALALAEWPDLAPVTSEPGAAPPTTDAGRVSILPEALRGAVASPVSAPPAEALAPPPAVPTTPVALKALGYAQAADGSAQIVLSNGNALFVVNEGQEFLDRFRVVSLGPEGVDVEDRLTNQTLHLTFGN